jgi:hypothetical protein
MLDAAIREKESEITLVAVAGSAGGFLAMREILSQLPPDFSAPILYIQHLGNTYSGILPKLLEYRSALKVQWATSGDFLKPGCVYVCPPKHFLTVHPIGFIYLRPITSFLDVLHSADVLFNSVAQSFGKKSLAMVLSGGGRDGADGICSISEKHGTVVVQDEISASVKGMPNAAIATGRCDFVVPLENIAPMLINLVHDRHSVSAVRLMNSSMNRSFNPLGRRELQAKLLEVFTSALSSQKADLGNFQLFDPVAGDLNIVMQRGFGMNFLNYFSRVNEQDGTVCARAMNHQSAVWIEDVYADPLFVEHYDIAHAAGFRAVHSVPVISSNQKFLGVLSAHYRTPRRFNLDQLLRFQQYAFRAAYTIEQMNGSITA